MGTSRDADAMNGHSTSSISQNVMDFIFLTKKKKVKRTRGKRRFLPFQSDDPPFYLWMGSLMLLYGSFMSHRFFLC